MKIIKITIRLLLLIFLILFTADRFSGETISQMTYPKRIDPVLQTYMDYTLDRCAIIGKLDFCKEKIKYLTRLEFAPQGSFQLGYKETVIGMAWMNPITLHSHIFINEYLILDDLTLKTTVVHELGHIMGLDHFDDDPDIMNAVDNGALRYRDINYFTDLVITRAYLKEYGIK